MSTASGSTVPCASLSRGWATFILRAGHASIRRGRAVVQASPVGITRRRLTRLGEATRGPSKGRMVVDATRVVAAPIGVGRVGSALNSPVFA